MHHRGMDDEVPAAVLAEFIGVSPRSLTELGRRGVAVRAGPGRWRLQESVRRYCDGLRHRGGGEAVRTTTTVERGRLAKEQADSFALKNARLRGSLVEREAVEREWSEHPDGGSARACLRCRRGCRSCRPARSGGARRRAAGRADLGNGADP